MAESVVEQFHSQYDAAAFDQIYDAAAADFQKVVGRQQFREFISAVRRKLGTVRETSQRAFNITVTSGSSRVVLQYRTRFSEGEGTETFTVAVRASSATLLGYDISSAELVTR